MSRNVTSMHPSFPHPSGNTCPLQGQQPPGQPMPQLVKHQLWHCPGPGGAPSGKMGAGGTRREPRQVVTRLYYRTAVTVAGTQACTRTCR